METCKTEIPVYSNAQTLLANIPYMGMTALGAVILFFTTGEMSVLWAALYAVYGAAGALWIMAFLCPHCRFHDTRSCPCGYGSIAAKLRKRQSEDRFNEKFKKHIPVIVPLWFIPPAAAGLTLWKGFSWAIAAMMAAFVLDSFVVLPLLSKRHCCERCPQKETCPWMGTGEVSG